MKTAGPGGKSRLGETTRERPASRQSLDTWGPEKALRENVDKKKDIFKGL